MSDNLNVRVDGIGELKKAFENLDLEGRKRVNRAINVNALEMKREVIKGIRKNSGRYRRRYHWGKGHKGKKRGVRRGSPRYSSIPGSPPNSDTGNLVENIRLSRTNAVKSRRAFARVISGAKYSWHLEKGSNKSSGRGSGIKARPFMEPVLRRRRAIFAERIKDAIRGLL